MEEGERTRDAGGERRLGEDRVSWSTHGFERAELDVGLDSGP